MRAPDGRIALVVGRTNGGNPKFRYFDDLPLESLSKPTYCSHCRKGQVTAYVRREGQATAHCPDCGRYLKHIGSAATVPLREAPPRPFYILTRCSPSGAGSLCEVECVSEYPQACSAAVRLYSGPETSHFTRDRIEIPA